MTKKNKQSGPKWNTFFYHVLLFVCVHLLFILIFGVLPLAELDSVSYWDYIKNNFMNKGITIYQNSTANRISSIWKTILIIHLIIEIIETLFPKKEKEKKVEEQKIEKTDENSVVMKEEKESSGRAWVYLIIAGILEIIWATALKMDMLAGPIIIVLIISFELLIKSVKRLGVGTAYAVFTGIGTVGIVIVDFVVFQETMSFLKVLLIFLLIVFIIGLKVSSNEQEDIHS